ncbi:MAG: nuclear transport factor 2 family protein [Saprospiraceae bacterium]|nr:nuclear transport factor 2 family protein [Saprospiraceae bacterium]
MILKRSYTLILLAILIAGGLKGQNAAEKSVFDTEQHRFEAMMRADTAALRPLLADDLLYVHSNALTENKAAHLEAIAQRTLVYEKIERKSATIRLYGKTALVNGTAAVRGNLKGNAFEINLLYSALYRKKKGVWQLCNWQSTRIP